MSSQAEILRLFGTLDNHKIAQIDGPNPLLDGLEINAVYLAGTCLTQGKRTHQL